ncbi:hypothetical protein HDU97_010260 [Phlyctochytrium planicorne]|nr:hypothetical protein HDU97_010260 [Phlyctochytrium planicorne]
MLNQKDNFICNSWDWWLSIILLAFSADVVEYKGSDNKIVQCKSGCKLHATDGNNPVEPSTTLRTDTRFFLDTPEKLAEEKLSGKIVDIPGILKEYLKHGEDANMRWVVRRRT